MMDSKKTEEIAVNRHKIIAPILTLIEEKADAAKVVQLKKIFVGKTAYQSEL